jgi:hypothetical protein
MVMVNIDGEQISRLVFRELELSLQQLRNDIELDNPQIFSMNEVTDKIQIQKHIDAFELIVEWYREPSY